MRIDERTRNLSMLDIGHYQNCFISETFILLGCGPLSANFQEWNICSMYPLHIQLFPYGLMCVIYSLVQWQGLFSIVSSILNLHQ
jgi:hypothetical protein